MIGVRVVSPPFVEENSRLTSVITIDNSQNKKVLLIGTKMASARNDDKNF